MKLIGKYVIDINIYFKLFKFTLYIILFRTQDVVEDRVRFDTKIQIPALSKNIYSHKNLFSIQRNVFQNFRLTNNYIKSSV